MRGDMNKIIEEVNRVLDGVFKQIETLSDRIAQLEEKTAKKPVGRPPKVPKEVDKAA
jgi:hypothetical protein